MPKHKKSVPKTKEKQDDGYDDNSAQEHEEQLQAIDEHIIEGD